MKYQSIAPDFAVAGQITPSDIPAIKDAGFKTVICNRPDGEEAGQPTAETIGEAVRAAGLTFIAIPMAAGVPPTSDVVIETQEVLNTLPGPYFAYCRSGNRAAQAWMQATQG
ncbi:TIGR01244 family phosphatase [Acetobacter fabarum]|jgi:uncharacterized protein (TIGR01244 family)|uniref:TIGR01244 family protein n=1 Tax=Acetobacter fabarum TaxID=483199 RepID=A0A269Y1Q7_9PROT|nr:MULTISPECIES: TIGR01244 family sulfur transferase [Acetobacter]MCH4026991.1 TIGR01244 family sulfur transferase [Acetobacter fabarum]MCH4055556.1 TIGR01244 family sulfur transferase [Acetobacter fabarum]MCH4085148.1 TIGR01244 family sulfur transferase [Acetobacter fabarum]MCH4127646.1 TIGR01244 family sulfur transferase [Acetobacter fabarum]MCH4137609.1 TIGR01244 family sulfur transferase [Acetobacter fabarum]